MLDSKRLKGSAVIIQALGASLSLALSMVKGKVFIVDEREREDWVVAWQPSLSLSLFPLLVALQIGPWNFQC